VPPNSAAFARLIAGGATVRQTLPLLRRQINPGRRVEEKPVIQKNSARITGNEASQTIKGERLPGAAWAKEHGDSRIGLYCHVQRELIKPFHHLRANHRIAERPKRFEA
jgi:hypothetical protein